MNHLYRRVIEYKFKEIGLFIESNFSCDGLVVLFFVFMVVIFHAVQCCVLLAVCVNV